MEKTLRDVILNDSRGIPEEVVTIRTKIDFEVNDVYGKGYDVHLRRGERNLYFYYDIGNTIPDPYTILKHVVKCGNGGAILAGNEEQILWKWIVENSNGKSQ